MSIHLVRRILSELSGLLARYGYDRGADFIGGLVDEGETKEFWEVLAGLELWGGSGAIWEIEPFHSSHPKISTAREDYRRFQALMIEIADLLEARGQAKLAARNADLFRREPEH